MFYEVEYTNEFESRWDALPARAQNDVSRVVKMLVTHWPELSYPQSSAVWQSRHGYMRELRIQSQDELPESLGAATADGQGATALQSHTITATSGGFYLQNLIEPHDRGAMYAQELGWIQPLFEFVESAVHEVTLGAGVNPRIVPFGLYPADG